MQRARLSTRMHVQSDSQSRTDNQLTYDFMFQFINPFYSRVPNRRVRWNKRVGGKIAGNLINKLDEIKELDGKRSEN